VRHLARTLELSQVQELMHKLDQTRINVFNHILTSTLAQNFARTKIFRNSNFQVLATRLEALRTSIPSKSQPFEVQKGFIQQIQRLWFDVLKLNTELVNLSADDLETLEAYLKANKLMVECRDSAVWIKPETWKGIEERMLTVRSSTS
jgi:hypothetical protein